MSWRKVADLEAEGVIRVEDGNHGEYRPRAEEFSTGITSFIRAADMDRGRVLFESAEKIADSAVARIRKGHGKPGDVLFSHKGTVGKLAIVGEDAPPFVCSPQTTFWRSLNADVLDQRFLYCFLRSPDFSEQWESRKGETDMADYVSLTAQRELKVNLPSIETQRHIARIVAALDDKIELNRRMNRTLEALAQKLFKSWFVDFDPVLAKSEGRKPFGLSDELAALFPNEFEGSEQGAIPRGWRVLTIGQEASVLGGSTPATDEPEYWTDGRHCWVTPRDLSRLDEPVLLDTERRITDAGLARISSGLLPPGTVLLSSRAPIGYVAVAGMPTAINQGFIAIRCDKSLPNQFVRQWVSENMGEIEARAGGTTFAEISKSAFRPIPVIVPSTELLEAFQAQAATLFERLSQNVKQSNVLATLRDLLLPRLLSGELRVPDAEREIEAIV